MNKPINRPRIFFLVSVIFAVNTYCLLAEVLNSSFTAFLNSILNATKIPNYLLLTNIKIMTLYVPLIIIILTFRDSLSLVFRKDTRKELLEYSIDILTRNVNEISEKTINIKLCEDISTGEDIILTETSSKQHMLIGGSSGSGKTALLIRPMLAQLFYKKAYFQEKLKSLTFEALEEGLCYFKYPVTYKYANEHFSMDLIEYYSDKKDAFLEKFKDYIIGIREGNTNLHNSEGFERILNIPIHTVNSAIKREINIDIDVYYDDLILEKYNYIYKDENISGPDIENEDYIIKLNITDCSSKESEDTSTSEEILNIILNTKVKDKNRYTYKVNVQEKVKGKIIYRDLGITVVAPDGGLPSNTIDIAKKNGIKVHKIDPKMEEIATGKIAKFNPIMVGTPEKAADVISSILVAMEQSAGKDSNPYFTNASIRAIRNIVILLRLTYPKLRGKNPTLLDVLDILNDFNLVREYVEELQSDSRTELRWKSVIDYFISSFYPQPKDEKGGLLFNTNEGVNRKKVGEAISGCINQLDNLLGREELRYILCDSENSLDLAEVLENGECLAIATRQSELGSILGKAFALLFILSMQNAVLCRFSEDENPEIPHYLIIDEFPFYINDNLSTFFTFSRKYKCSLICAIQNVAQLCEETEVFKEIVFSNTATKMILPGSNVEDRKYYSEMLGMENVFESQTGVSENPIFSENANYTETTRGGIVEKAKVSTEEIADLKFKRCYYLYTNSKGEKKIGKGYIDFLKYGEDNIIEKKYFDFEKFNPDISLINTKGNQLKDTTENTAIEEQINIYNNVQMVEVDNLVLENDITNLGAENEKEEKQLEDNSTSSDKNKEQTLSEHEQFIKKTLLASNDTEKKTEKKYVENNVEDNIENLDISKLEIEGLTQE